MPKDHSISVRIYYEDIDVNGHVYHANYIKYLERARTEFLRDLNIETSALLWSQSDAIMFVVRKLDIEYFGAAKLDDVVEVRSKVVKLAGASMIMAQDIYRNGAMITGAILKLALVNGQGKPVRFPQALRTKIQSVMQ